MITSRLSKKRRWADFRFRFYGILAIGFAMTMLFILLGTVITKGTSAFFQYEVKLQVTDAKNIPKNIQGSLKKALYEHFSVTKRKEKKSLAKLLSSGADRRLRKLHEKGELTVPGEYWVLLSDDADSFLKGFISRDVPESQRRIKDNQIQFLDTLTKQGLIKKRFNWQFFTSGDSREPELAGLWGAMKGSFLLMCVTFLLSFPLGVMTAIYLEEFAPKNRVTDFIEVNINNLAAVPSIVFGLLGLALFLNVFGLPRSAPITGGIVLSLMTLPTIIISSRAAIGSVPPSLKEAALGLGASRMQAMLHHVLPEARPAILTGSIIGMAQALGETAPLLMIGMVAFIADIPQGFTDPATALPVQIFIWYDSPERAFQAKTNAAIMVLLGFLILMNGLAAYIRRRSEVFKA